MSRLQRVATLPRQSLIAMKVAFGMRAQYATMAALGVVVLTQILGVIIFTGKAIAYAPDEFVTTWQTNNPGATASNQITIPTSGGGYNYSVDWGDGNSSTGVTGTIIHTYAVAGVYTVTITGDFPGIFFMNPDTSVINDDNKKLLSIEQWGSNQWQSMRGAFYGASNLVLNATDAPDLSQVTSMRRMFNGASSLNSNLNSWDVSNVTDMNGLFANATSFNQPLNSWDVSHVTDMGSMFNSASAFNQDISSWDVSQVTSMRTMFSSATSFNQPLNNWDTASLTDIYAIFGNASAFNRPLNNWKVGGVSDMSFVFSGATSFNQSLASWDVSSVTNMTAMLLSAPLSVYNYDATLRGWALRSLQSGVTLHATSSKYCNGSSARQILIDTYSWSINDGGLDSACDPWQPDEFVTTWKTDNPGTSPSNQITVPTEGAGYNYTVDWGDGNTTSGHTAAATHTYATPGTYTIAISGSFPRISFLNYYNECEKILSVEQWGTSPWTSMRYAFAGAKNLQINALDDPDLSGVTDMRSMFVGASSFNTDINDWDVSSVIDMSFMFYGASAFNQNIDGWDVSSVTTMEWMFASALAFNQPLNSWDVSNVTNMSLMFWTANPNDTPPAFNQPLNNWDTSSVTNMAGMFEGAIAFNQPLDQWDTSSVTNMNYMFADPNWSSESVDHMAFNQSLNTWDVSNVTDMRHMFYSALAFNQPLNNWDTSSVTNMSYMFVNARAFNQNLNSWDVSSVTGMTNMFYYALAFNQPLDQWDTSSVTDMRAMFQFAAAFDQSLGSWDISNVTQMDDMFGNYDAYLESVMGDAPYESWPDYLKALYNLPESRLSAENYDVTLLGWSQQVLQTGVTFSAGDSTYCNALVARQTIISLYNWTIRDGGNGCVTVPEPEIVPQEPIVPEKPIGPIPQELLPVLDGEQPAITDVTPVPGSAPTPTNTTSIKAPQNVVTAQNSIFALAKRIPEPFAIGFPWLLLLLSLILVSIQYYQVHRESLSTKRMQASVAHQKQLVEEQNNFVALSTHYLHTPLTVMEGEISLMVKAGTLTQAQASKLRATLASLSAEAEAALAQEDSDRTG